MNAMAFVLALCSCVLSIGTLLIVFQIGQNVNRLQEQLNIFVTTEPAQQKGWQVTYRDPALRKTVTEIIDAPTEADVIRELIRRGVNPATVTCAKTGP